MVEQVHDPAVIVTKAYDFALWLLPKAEKFPRSYRFSIGDRLVASGLDLLLHLVDAAYSSDKREPLRQAARQINCTRYLLHLSKGLKLISHDSYAFAAERLEEVGRMAGGWQKSSTRTRGSGPEISGKKSFPMTIFSLPPRLLLPASAIVPTSPGLASILKTRSSA